MRFAIATDNRQLAELRSLLKDDGKFKVAATRALNKTADHAAVQARRAIAAYLKVPIRKLGSNAGKHKGGLVKPLHVSGRLKAGVRVADYNLPMIVTHGVPQKGESLPLGKESDPESIDQTPFEQTVLSGHLGWFVRHGEKRVMQAGRYRGKIRQPIRQIYANSPRRVWEHEHSIAADTVNDMQPTLEMNLVSQINRLLSRKQSRR